MKPFIWFEALRKKVGIRRVLLVIKRRNDGRQEFVVMGFIVFISEGIIFFGVKRVNCVGFYIIF